MLGSSRAASLGGQAKNVYSHPSDGALVSYWRRLYYNNSLLFSFFSSKYHQKCAKVDKCNVKPKRNYRNYFYFKLRIFFLLRLVFLSIKIWKGVTKKRVSHEKKYVWLPFLRFWKIQLVFLIKVFLINSNCVYLEFQADLRTFNSWSLDLVTKIWPKLVQN